MKKFKTTSAVLSCMVTAGAANLAPAQERDEVAASFDRMLNHQPIPRNSVQESGDGEFLQMMVNDMILQQQTGRDQRQADSSVYSEGALPCSGQQLLASFERGLSGTLDIEGGSVPGDGCR